MTGYRNALHVVVLVALLVWLGMARHGVAATVAMPAPQSLTADYLADPLGIGEARPRLAWKLAFPERAGVETPYGRLASGWQVDGEGLRIDVTIPPNTRSTVVLPGARLPDVRLDGKPLAAAGIAGAVQQGDDVAIDLGAGSYGFAYTAGRR